jgi:hypothetical protein
MIIIKFWYWFSINETWYGINEKNGYNQFYLNASPMAFKGLGTMDLVDFYKSLVSRNY